MTKYINASNFYLIHLDPHCIVYSASNKDVKPFKSFEEAKKLTTYQESFSPFAQIIINTQTNEFILVRDHLGIRPLYYYYQDNKLIFGDTIPDILRHLPQPPKILDKEMINLFSDSSQYTDNTIYKDIYRIEPGHMMLSKTDGYLTKSAFWQLEPTGTELQCKDEREYLEHFDSLMNEAIQKATENTNNIALEFSAGMDSTAIYCACNKQGLNPALFMHSAPSGSVEAQIYNKKYENAFIQQFPETIIHNILADNFDAIKVFKNYANWFSGPTPYIFELFAHNVHKAVAANNHSILLSGFGGDQGVSGHVPPKFFLPELFKERKYYKAWLATLPHRETQTKTDLIRRLLLLTQYAHPLLNQWVNNLRDSKLMLHNIFKPSQYRKYLSQHAYSKGYFKTLREAEWSFLQGPNSHEIRMRIEYSSIVAKKMGFEYRYPLLYPKLLEFYLSLPLAQKRHHGKGRYMMQRYLARHIPSGVFDSYTKHEGLYIFPATMNTFKSQLADGKFQDKFRELPYQKLIQDASPHKQMIKTIQAFMLKEANKHL